MSADPIPSLPRGTRLHHDTVRGAMVLLAPEKALILDEIGAAILGAVDGSARLSTIVARLAARYDAPLAEVAGDCAEFLRGLAADRVIDLHD